MPKMMTERIYGRSTETLISTRRWCEDNPGKTAVIYMPKGTLTLRFDRKPVPLKGQE